MIRRVFRFARLLPGNIRLSGGVFNPWLRRAVISTWRQTGPPPPPLEIPDEEMDAFLDAIGARDQ